ncbi:MAG: ABC transporter substrate-binding protein, partial [Oscillospiraceae bacterium]|nr:ABC transporter substrate-binding protein [Oscillospiraceae bacterium]
MNTIHWRKRTAGLMACLLALLQLTGCAPGGTPAAKNASIGTHKPERPSYLVAIEDEPDTVDFQCTTIHYTIAQNVFDRLVETETSDNGTAVILPSLAESWEVSADRRTYTFRLRDGVTFSNGSALTASDVRYTLTRLLTHPASCNRDIALPILGAEALARGEVSELAGFAVLGALEFSVTLTEPYEAFLACLSMPGASILDEESTEAAQGRFGLEPACTVGTGSFILDTWEPGSGMQLSANPNCWKGAPRCDGLDLRFVTDPQTVRLMFERGELDILSLDDLDSSAEFFFHGDIYQSRLQKVQQVGISYIALNQSVRPLNDVRVRRALQLALNRPLLLDAAYSGRGSLENGIFPRGLYGYNPELAEIPYDPEQAAALLAEAGYPNGFDLTVSLSSSSTRNTVALLRLAVTMWESIGVRSDITVLDDEDFIAQRRSGALACYTATWTADYNDPDNFISTFFGSRENTRFRSLCYPDEAVMQQVRNARLIADP